MLLFAGLGNPGPTYAKNRHNIGFMAVDAIADHFGFSAPRKRFNGIAREGIIETAGGPKKALILKPETFMNESGRSIGGAVTFYRLNPASITVFHDELDLLPGKIRVKVGGGVAGHNGLRSTAAQIGLNFKRVRMGIGHPGKDKVLSWVLEDFSKTDFEWVETLCDAVAKSADMLAEGGRDDAFQTKVALLAPAPEPAPWLRGAKQSSAL